VGTPSRNPIRMTLRVTSDLDDGSGQEREATVEIKGGRMDRPSLARLPSPRPVRPHDPSGIFLAEPAATEDSRTGRPDPSLPNDTVPRVGVRLVIITASGNEMPLVTPPCQAARLLDRLTDPEAAGDGGADGPDQARMGSERLRPAPVGRWLSRVRLIDRCAEAPGGDAA
jgi:hypothetical protein